MWNHVCPGQKSWDFYKNTCFELLSVQVPLHTHACLYIFILFWVYTYSWRFTMHGNSLSFWWTNLLRLEFEPLCNHTNPYDVSDSYIFFIHVGYCLYFTLWLLHIIFHTMHNLPHHTMPYCHFDFPFLHDYCYFDVCEWCVCVWGHTRHRMVVKLKQIFLELVFAFYLYLDFVIYGSGIQVAKIPFKFFYMVSHRAELMLIVLESKCEWVCVVIQFLVLTLG